MIIVQTQKYKLTCKTDTTVDANVIITPAAKHKKTADCAGSSWKNKNKSGRIANGPTKSRR